MTDYLNKAREILKRLTINVSIYNSKYDSIEIVDVENVLARALKEEREQALEEAALACDEEFSHTEHGQYYAYFERVEPIIRALKDKVK